MSASFADDVISGLHAQPETPLQQMVLRRRRATASSSDIMEMPEYYLTDAEREIYQTCAPDLLDAIGEMHFRPHRTRRG